MHGNQGRQNEKEVRGGVRDGEDGKTDEQDGNVKTENDNQSSRDENTKEEEEDDDTGNAQAAQKARLANTTHCTLDWCPGDWLWDHDLI